MIAPVHRQPMATAIGTTTPVSGCDLGIDSLSERPSRHTADPIPQRSEPVPECRPHHVRRTSNYLPDMTNNPFHGFESFKLPVHHNTARHADVTPSATMPAACRSIGSASTADTIDQRGTRPAYPTYDRHGQLDGALGRPERGRRDEPVPAEPAAGFTVRAERPRMALPPAGRRRLALTSRLSQLAPISFTNTIDGQRRRRLFALDTWELEQLRLGQRQSGEATFANNSRFTRDARAPSFATLSNNLHRLRLIATPSLAQRDKKINLNYPAAGLERPQRAGPAEMDQRHLPALRHPAARAVDTAEELAQLSQYVINIVDFRDPDATMTHWVNPDVVLRSLGDRRRPPPTPCHADTCGQRSGRCISTSMAWSTTRSRSTRPWLTRYKPLRHGHRTCRPTASSSSWSIRSRAAYNPYSYLRQHHAEYVLRQCQRPRPGRVQLHRGRSLLRRLLGPRLHRRRPRSRPDPYRGDLLP